MKILVTGGTGVIGAAAIPALLQAGNEVRLLSRHAARDAQGLPAGVEAFVADIANPDPLREAMAGCGAVLHIAGIVEERPPEATFEKINVEGTRALCAAAEATGRPFFVFISSLGAERGQSDYHRSKLRAEEHVRGYAGPWVILRPGNVYGPGDETISMLLKMTRTLPVVPMVGEGDQPFQPLWYADLGAGIARVMERDQLAGRVLELAGPDVTTTDAVLDHLARVTGRHPARIPVPAWVARIGAHAAESFGPVGRGLLSGAGFSAPLNSAKLQMLLEGNVIEDPRGNALVSVLGLTPTRLATGLEMLADLLPEQTPGEGVGAITRTTYAAEIVGAALSASELLEEVCANLGDVMPLEFAAEPGAPTHAEEGIALTAEIPVRGNIQVRMKNRTETSATFVTLEGHPLAGVLTLAAEPAGNGIRFAVEILAQPANVADWLALRTVGNFMQAKNWRAVVRRVIELSGGEAPKGIQKQSERLTREQGERLAATTRELIAHRKRRENQAALQRGM